MVNLGKKGTVKVVDEATTIEDAKIVKNITSLFQFISKETGLVLEIRREHVNYAPDYLVITLKVDTASGLTSGVAPAPGPVVAMFTSHKDVLTLPPSITIQFYGKYRDRLDSFVAATKKAAERFGVNIEIVVKEL